MKVTLLSGGVGGARMARGLAAVLDDLTVVTNVGDDDVFYGVHVSADLDTVLYTLAGVQGPQGWGMADDTFRVIDGLEQRGIDTRFRLGDTDLSTCLARTIALQRGEPLSRITATLAESFGVGPTLLPVTDDRLRTEIQIEGGDWLAFQDYFVLRRHQDPVTDVRFAGADSAGSAPGVIEALTEADLVVIAPSNPPLSIWPILAVDPVRDAVDSAKRVVAVSPLFGGKALKGPAAEVMAGVGLASGTPGILAAYGDLVTDLVVDVGDAADVDEIQTPVRLVAADTRIAEPDAGAAFARWLLEWTEGTS